MIPAQLKPVMTTTVLSGIGEPADLRDLTDEELSVLAEEIRHLLVDHVHHTGGHLGSNLGVVELTIALHRIFDSPRDRILFDTGHQSYVHKILTGRSGGFATLRKRGGLSGYPSRAESTHDVIENSHASTALSWADGLAAAHQVQGITDRHVVAVVGDGALTGGMCWEALNDIGGAGRPMVIVLNDNGRSYAPTVGGLADHLAGLRGPAGQRPPALFAGLGLRYVGPVDGHDRVAVEAALRQAKDLRAPVVVHCVTRKGAGYPAAERNEVDRMHAVPARTAGAATRSWTSVFAEEMVAIGHDRPDVVAVTAAMLDPVGLTPFAAAFPDRVFDVGIAEQHAATAAAGLALGGVHPVVAIYASFLNRAFDQLLLDAALHRAGVTFVLDRAGVTGDDGASHNGMWDLSLLNLIPGARIAAPRDGARLRALLRESVRIDAPTFVRYPKGALPEDIPRLCRFGGVDLLHTNGNPLAGGDVLIVAAGAMAATCLDVAAALDEHGLIVSVVDPRWIKPVDPAIAPLAARHRLVVTVEDSVGVGGFGDTIARTLREARVRTRVCDFGIAHRFFDHGSRAQVLAETGLTAAGITDRVLADVESARRHDELAAAVPDPAPVVRKPLIA